MLTNIKVWAPLPFLSAEQSYFCIQATATGSRSIVEMSSWYAKYADEQSVPPTARSNSKFGCTSPALSTNWEQATMGQAPSPPSKRPHMNPLQCDSRTTDVFR